MQTRDNQGSPFEATLFDFFHSTLILFVMEDFATRNGRTEAPSRGRFSNTNPLKSVSRTKNGSTFLFL